jgi:hypothetical protein
MCTWFGMAYGISGGSEIVLLHLAFMFGIGFVLFPGDRITQIVLFTLSQVRF